MMGEFKEARLVWAEGSARTQSSPQLLTAWARHELKAGGRLVRWVLQQPQSWHLAGCRWLVLALLIPKLLFLACLCDTSRPRRCDNRPRA